MFDCSSKILKSNNTNATSINFSSLDNSDKISDQLLIIFIEYYLIYR